MKKIIFSLIVSFLSISLMYCSSVKKNVVLNSSLNSSSTNEFHLRPYQEETLSNGLKILFIEESSLPKMNLNLLVKVGTLQEPLGLEGLNLMTVSLLDQGSSTRSATQVAEEFGQIGTQVFQKGEHDFTLITTSGLSSSKEKLLELFVDVVMNPSFQPKEIIRRKQEVVASIKQMADSPDEYTDAKMNLASFGHRKWRYENKKNGHYSSLF